jgi:hypothetical protein
MTLADISSWLAKEMIMLVALADKFRGAGREELFRANAAFNQDSFDAADSLLAEQYCGIDRKSAVRWDPRR